MFINRKTYQNIVYHSYTRLLLLSLILSLLLSSFVQAQCVSPYLQKNQIINQQFPKNFQSSDYTHVFADEVYGVTDKSWNAKGNVLINRNNQTIFTQEAMGNLQTNVISLPSNFFVTNQSQIIEFEKGEFDKFNKLANTGGGEFINQPQEFGEFFQGLVSQRSLNRSLSFRGNFNSFSTPSQNLGDFKGVRFTTCPEGEGDWHISATTLITNQETQIGEAYNATLWLGKLPIFYLPYMDFPLDGRRKSGFLLPEIEFLGEGDKNINFRGFNITLPYYVNLAPNYDWFIKPSYLNNRGVLWQNDFRYLFANSSGNFTLNYIKKDKDYLPTDYEFNQSRHRFYARHYHTITPNLNLTLLYNNISDSQYISDYSDYYYQENVINLPREIILNANYAGWSGTVGYHDYQNLSARPNRNKPSVRSPQIKFTSPNYQLNTSDSTDFAWGTFGNIYANVDGEYSNFTHEFRINNRRMWIYPKLQWQYAGLGGFANWQVGTHISNYRSENPITHENKDVSRTVPIFKIGGGLVFERELNDEGALQTFEPSLHWLYIPKVEQDEIPVIDTSRPAFTLSALDTDNLYSGWDRISDANVISIGLTNRFFEKSGREFLNISLGQRYFISKGEVLLPRETIQESNKSDFLLSANALLDKWRIEASWRRSAKTNKTINSEALISFQPKEDRLIGLRYISQETDALPRITDLQRDILGKVDLQEIVEGVIDWPLRDYLGKNISISGRNYFSLADDKILESRIALRYYSCCLGVSLYRKNVLIDENKYNPVWGIEFNLYGFGKIAQRSDRLLDEAFRPFRVR